MHFAPHVFFIFQEHSAKFLLYFSIFYCAQRQHEILFLLSLLNKTAKTTHSISDITRAYNECVYYGLNGIRLQDGAQISQPVARDTLG